MQREQAQPRQLPLSHQVAQVAAREAGRAGRARAAVEDRRVGFAPPRLGEVDAPAVLRIGHERHAMPAEPRRHGAVEGVDAQFDAADQVVDLPDAEQVARGRLRQLVHGPGDHLVHLRLVLAQGAADRDAAAAARGHGLRGGAAKVLEDAALDDPEEHLPGGRVVAVPAHAALQPAVRALGRRRRVVAADVKRRALVEGDRDVRAQGGLDGQRGLRRQERLAPVDVGAEADPVLVDCEDRPPPLRPLRGAALDLVGDRPVAHREDLEAPRVGDDRARPAHELVQPAEARHEVVAGREHEMERVAEHHVVAERGHVARLERLDRGLRRQRDEGRRPHRAVREPERAGPRPRGRVTGVDLEAGRHGEGV